MVPGICAGPHITITTIHHNPSDCHTFKYYTNTVVFSVGSYWKDDSCWAGQEILSFIEHKNSLSCSNKSVLDPFFCQFCPVHILIPHLRKIQFNIIPHPYIQVPQEVSLLLRIWLKFCAQFSCPCAYYMPSLSHLPWLNHLSTIR
jgi:hypothetical protein